MLNTTQVARRAVAVLMAAASVVAVASFVPASAASAPSRLGATAVEAQHTGPIAQERNKRVAVRVLTGLFEEGDLAVADRYVRAELIQHSPAIADGRDGLKSFVRDSRARFPHQTYDVTRVLAEGDLVLVHANPIHEPGTRGVARMNIFRFDRDGMIAEYWDTVQDVPATTVSGNDMFGTISNPHTDQPSGPRWLTPFSEQVVTSYFTALLIDKDPDAVQYLSPELYQHSPNVPNGTVGMREGLVEFYRQFPDVNADLRRVIADRDYVAVHFQLRLRPEDRGQAIMGIFRVERPARGELRIIEHWDVIQEIPATSANDNTMF